MKALLSNGYADKRRKLIDIALRPPTRMSGRAIHGWGRATRPISALPTKTA